MDFAIEQADIAQKPVLRHLMQLYMHDFSEFMGWQIGESGLFDDYRYLDH